MKGITRRQFLKASAATGALVSVGGFLSPRKAHAFYQSPGIRLFDTDLRGVGPGAIPVAATDGFAAPVTGVTHYTINIGQFTDQLLPSGFNPTTLWGFNPANPLGGGVQPQKHLGGIIVGQKGQPIQITFKNMLPKHKNSWGQIHPLPVDTTIPGAGLGQNRVAVHLHGGLVPWISDGGPFDWFDPGTTHGDSFLNNKVLNPWAGPGQAEYYYPLNQSARFMWYHDHAVGITRLNAYIGIASGMVIRDNFENNLKNLGLPEYIEVSVLGGTTVQELPLVFQDKIFVGKHIKKDDPTWTGAREPGSLWYAHTYDPNRWDLLSGGLTLPDPSSIPEFFGDTMLVNGTAYPVVEVQARRYRLRLLNACNARFLNLQLYKLDNSSPNGISLNDSGNPSNKPFINAATGKPTWLQIGTEGGFLAKPAEIPSNVPFLITDPDFLAGGPSLNPSKVEKSLLVASAERPDVIVDFSKYAGEEIILYNDAPAPYPSGDPVNDYFPGLANGNPVNGATSFDSGPNTRILMKFKVLGAQAPQDKKLFINEHTNLSLGLDPFLLPPFVHDVPHFIKRRCLTLNEYHDDYGRLIQILGNDQRPFGSPYFGMAKYLDYPPTATPKNVGSTDEDVYEGDVEAWEIYNTTGDVHPMHFHLVNVQVINRQVFDPASFPYNPSGPIIPPAKNETGWKETVPMYPGTVTRVIMKFDVPKIVTAQGKVIHTPDSPRTGGSEYVWHCHILEHEEHDMMHALVVH
jgi:spore coat protein A